MSENYEAVKKAFLIIPRLRNVSDQVIFFILRGMFLIALLVNDCESQSIAISEYYETTKKAFLNVNMYCFFYRAMFSFASE